VNHSSIIVLVRDRQDKIRYLYPQLRLEMVEDLGGRRGDKPNIEA
jgi:hypothetical protein